MKINILIKKVLVSFALFIGGKFFYIAEGNGETYASDLVEKESSILLEYSQKVFDSTYKSKGEEIFIGLSNEELAEGYDIWAEESERNAKQTERKVIQEEYNINNLQKKIRCYEKLLKGSEKSEHFSERIKCMKEEIQEMNEELKESKIKLQNYKEIAAEDIKESIKYRKESKKLRDEVG